MLECHDLDNSKRNLSHLQTSGSKFKPTLKIWFGRRGAIVQTLGKIFLHQNIDNIAK